MKRARLGILASGRGSNAEAVLRACSEDRLNAEGGVVISNHADAGVHQVAEKYGIPSFFIARDQFEDGKTFAQTLIDTFRKHNVHLILLAGYMRKVPPALLRIYNGDTFSAPGAVLNIHPALLPKHGGKGMYGHHVHSAVIAAGDKETGVTIHFVDEEYDRGPILYQEAGVLVLENDTPDSLAERVLELEHKAYAKAVGLWIERYFKLE